MNLITLQDGIIVSVPDHSDLDLKKERNSLLFRPFLDLVQSDDRQRTAIWLREQQANFSASTISSNWQGRACTLEAKLTMIDQLPALELQINFITPADKTQNGSNVISMSSFNQPQRAPLLATENQRPLIKPAASADANSVMSIDLENLQFTLERVLPYSNVRGRWNRIFSPVIEQFGSMSIEESESYNRLVIANLEQRLSQSKDGLGFVQLSSLALNLDTVDELFSDAAKQASPLLDRSVVFIDANTDNQAAIAALAYLSEVHGMQIGLTLKHVTQTLPEGIYIDFVHLSSQWTAQAISEPGFSEAALKRVDELQNAGLIIWADHIDDQATMSLVWNSKADLISGKLVAEQHGNYQKPSMQ